jgi:signal transduction histidine kinase
LLQGKTFFINQYNYKVKDNPEEKKSDRFTNDLIQRNKDLEQFSYIVAHNLRGPVANIRGLFNVIELNREDEATFKKCVQGIQSSIDRLDEILLDLNSILQIRKDIDRGKTAVKFSDTVSDISLMIKDLIESENAVIRTDFSDMDSIVTIKSYIYSIFYNLITNGIKYRRDGVSPVITISSKVADGKVLLVFKDNSLGIDLKANGEKLFGLYQRFHPDVDGKGVGLFMVKTEVELLGGNISVESVVGEGTVFTIEFPPDNISGS